MSLSSARLVKGGGEGVTWVVRVKKKIAVPFSLGSNRVHKKKEGEALGKKNPHFS